MADKPHFKKRHWVYGTLSRQGKDLVAYNQTTHYQYDANNRRAVGRISSRHPPDEINLPHTTLSAQSYSGRNLFFTVNLLERKSALLSEHIAELRKAVQVNTATTLSYRCQGYLPDQMYAIWTLPPGDE